MQIEQFSTELSWIKDDIIREFTAFCLKNAPAYFWTSPSSSTGKYHSGWSNGDGGLLRHTKATAFVAKELADAYGLVDQYKDAAIAAAILHDITKYGLPGGKHTTKDHDYSGAKFVHGLAKLFGKDVPLLMELCGGIAWHFGKWTTRLNGQEVRKFPEEYTKIEQLVHVADMVASRRGIDFHCIAEQSLVG